MVVKREIADAAPEIVARQCHCGPFSVSDPRPPAKTDRLVARIISDDNTWHRPFTTLELAALQSLVEPEEQLELDGLSDGAWRERIGNAVPPDAAQAIGETMARTLLMAWSGQGFRLSALPIWVRPIAVALSVIAP
jgi:site-specific DNA-cytosine methylase